MKNNFELSDQVEEKIAKIYQQNDLFASLQQRFILSSSRFAKLRAESFLPGENGTHSVCLRKIDENVKMKININL